jgi:CDP-diacylglycerol---glycerol-3-phosphate 3-phosphatidyltransferase
MQTKTNDFFSTPNKITYTRIALIPLFVIFLFMDFTYRDYIAAFIFISLSLSDALDGYIARKKNQITSMGKILDPIADKLLISTALVFLSLVGRMQLWMAVIIITRELIITLARIFFLPKKVVISSSNLGKTKTMVQVVSILAVILNAPFNWWIMLIAVVITVVSGLDYLRKMGTLIGEDVMNIPNMITTFRLLLIPLCIINLVKSKTSFALIVLAIFILSDKLDGLSARISKEITKFGRIYDALTDFLLVISSYFAFYMNGALEPYWIAVFSIPSITIAITRISRYSKYKEMESGALGKIVIGLSYVAVISMVIRFEYRIQILVLVSAIVYVYTAQEVYHLVKEKRKPRFF